MQTDIGQGMAAIDVNLVERVDFSDSDDDGFEYKAVDAEDDLDDDDDAARVKQLGAKSSHPSDEDGGQL